MYTKRIVAQQRFDAHACSDSLAVTFLHPEPDIFLWCNGITVWVRFPIGDDEWGASGVLLERLDDAWVVVAIPCDDACGAVSRAFAQEDTRAATLRGRFSKPSPASQHC